MNSMVKQDELRLILLTYICIVLCIFVCYICAYLERRDNEKSIKAYNSVEECIDENLFRLSQTARLLINNHEAFDRNRESANDWKDDRSTLSFQKRESVFVDSEMPWSHFVVQTVKEMHIQEIEGFYDNNDSIACIGFYLKAYISGRKMYVDLYYIPSETYSNAAALIPYLYGRYGPKHDNKVSDDLPLESKNINWYYKIIAEE